MRNSKILVSFLPILAALFVVSSVAALDWDGDLVENTFSSLSIEIDDIPVNGDEISVIGGDTMKVEVWFTSDVYDKDVTVEAELEGDKLDVNAITSPFDVEPGKRYKKTLTIKVPYELQDELNDKLELNIEIDGEDHKTKVDAIELNVQRPSYNVGIKSVSTPQSVQAGEEFPVEVVLKNIGYNDLDDLYVTASIKELGIMKSGYFGDIVALECDDSDDNEFPWSFGTLNRNCDEDDPDSVSGKLMLEVPYGTKAGTYSLEVVVENEDTTKTANTQVVVENEFDTTVYKSGMSLWIVNPTNNVVGYRLVAESPASVSESIVFVPAGASKSVAVTSGVEGEYNFNVNVFTLKGDLVDKVNFSGSGVANGAAVDGGETNPIVVLTVILAIIFIVLLIVLIVLIGKKPEKSGEFGESYY